MDTSTGERQGLLHYEGNAYRVISAAETLGTDFHRWPMVLRLLAENVARCAPPQEREAMLTALRHWRERCSSTDEISFRPGRLLMHDTTSTPALVDMAAMRDTIAGAGGDPEQVSPTLPVEVSVDHSLAVEVYATPDAPARNIQLEIRRNRERYRFLKWAAGAMSNIHINPPGSGIMHTINLEQLATVATVHTDGEVQWIAPDMMLGTDSHTPMVNGLGVLGWGIGGLEAETVMFGMPTTLKLPDVVGVHLAGRLQGGVTATDLALVVTQRLRELGVTGEFVEFYGPGVTTLSVGDRAVVANMAPEYGATTGYFPVDQAVLDYLAVTGRSQQQQNLVHDYFRSMGYWFDPTATPDYSRTINIDLDAVSPGAAGPRRPQDHVAIAEIPAVLAREKAPLNWEEGASMPEFPVALASITSCTNTSDPRLLIAAGLLARRARERGLSPAPWVKTSLAPGSPAAVSYLARAGLDEDLSAVGFDVVGFGCATCIGNSGPLPLETEQGRRAEQIRPVAILSGNRNFPGRIHPDLDLGFLMSPPMVVAYALAGDAAVDLSTAVFGVDEDGREVRLADLWPTPEEIDHTLAGALDPDDFARDFRTALENPMWKHIDAPTGPLFPWDPESTILRPPPFAAADSGGVLGPLDAHPLLVLGDDITTDHISPASAIPPDSFVADYLVARGEDRDDLNVFASRRGNWEVMARGAYFSKAVSNALAPDAGIAMTTHGPSGDIMSIWDAANRYRADSVPVMVIAGDRYGMGSSRDWAAKAQKLLGVRTVVAASYERIHRSNLIGMGILPLTYPADVRERLQEIDAATVLSADLSLALAGPRASVPVTIRESSGDTWEFFAEAAVDTGMEVELLRAGGVIPKILDRALSAR